MEAKPDQKILNIMQTAKNNQEHFVREEQYKTGLFLSETKPQHKATRIKIVCAWHKDRVLGQNKQLGKCSLFADEAWGCGGGVAKSRGAESCWDN